MKTYFKAKHPLFGRANTRLPIGYQQRSPYYWWWEFLRRNEDYLACCRDGGKGALAGLYRDFGDVLNDSFREWWTDGERGARLFGEKPHKLNLRELKSPGEWDPNWTTKGVMVVAVPLDMSKRYLQSRFAHLLKGRHDGKRGRKSLSDPTASTAEYPLYRNVSIETLRIQLEVYDKVMAKRRGELKKTLAKIGEEMRLVKNAMPSLKDLPRDAEYKRNVMAATVSRHFKDAQRIVTNVTKGQFPNSR
jgi:hypothetical protein